MHLREIEEDRVSLFDGLRYDCPPGVHPRLHVCTPVLQRSSTICQKAHYQVSRHNLTYIPSKCISSIYVTTCFIYQTDVLICVGCFLFQCVLALRWNPVLWVKCVHATCDMFLAVFCPVITRPLLFHPQDCSSSEEYTVAAALLPLSTAFYRVRK